MNPKRRVCKITNNFQKAGVMLWQSTVLGRLWHRITDATQQDANLWPAPKNERIRVCKKAQRWARRVLKLCLWTDETWTFIWVMGKQRCGGKKGTANDPKHTASSVKHGGGGVMAWACMAVSGTGPLNFTDDLMYDDSSRMNYKTILSTNIQENASRFIGKCFISEQ